MQAVRRAPQASPTRAPQTSLPRRPHFAHCRASFIPALLGCQPAHLYDMLRVHRCIEAGPPGSCASTHTRQLTPARRDCLMRSSGCAAVAAARRLHAALLLQPAELPRACRDAERRASEEKAKISPGLADFHILVQKFSIFRYALLQPHQCNTSVRYSNSLCM